MKSRNLELNKGEVIVIIGPAGCGKSTLLRCLNGLEDIQGGEIYLGDDCKTIYHASAQVIGEGISLCIDALKQVIPAGNILLISPPLLGNDVWKPEKDPEFDADSVRVCGQLKEVYRLIAQTQGIDFLSASDIVEPSPVDDEHMTADGHRKLAQAIFDKIDEMIIV